MKRLLLILFVTFFIISPVQGEFFKDVIVTSPTGIWTDSRAYSSLSNAITAIGASEQDLYIAKEETVTTLVIPANIRLHFLKDGAIANSNTLTINTKNIHADHQIFTGAGAVNFASSTEVRTRWFEDFETAITQTSNDTVTLLVDTADTLANSAAVGNNVLLKWNASNLITIAAGQTLSNIGDIDAPGIRLFVVSGAVAFKAQSPLKEVRADWFGSTLATLDIADNAAAAAGKPLLITPGAWVIDVNLAISSHAKVALGADLQVANNITLTFSTTLDAGLYKIFSCTGTGAVDLSSSSTIVAYPEWWGANTTPGTTDMTAAVQAAADSLPAGGVLKLQPAIYLVQPLNIYASIRIEGTGNNYGANTERTILQAAADQTHILVFGGEDNSNWKHGCELNYVSINGNNKTISDALLVLQYQSRGKVSRSALSTSYTSRAIRFKNVMDWDCTETVINAIGVDGDCVMYVDEKEGSYWSNELRFTRCQIENNRGSILETHASNSGADNIIFNNCDFEGNNATAGNTIAAPIFSLGDVARFWATNCRFSNYNTAVHVELINANGTASRPAEGIVITGNQFMACTLAVTLGQYTMSAMIKDNIAPYTATLSLANSSQFGSVIFEPLLRFNERGRYNLAFDDKRTPFISIADIGTVGSGYNLINDASAESLGTTGVLWYKSLSAAGNHVASFDLKRFANFPGNVEVWLRGKTANNAGGLVHIYLSGTSDYTPGNNTFDTTWEWKRYIITKAQLATAAVTAGEARIFIASSTDEYYFDGVYIVPVLTSQKVKSLAYDAGGVTPDISAGKIVKISDIGTAATLTVNAPTGMVSGDEWLLDLTNGANACTITWNAVFKADTYTSLTASKRAVCRFYYDGTNHVLCGLPTELTP